MKVAVTETINCAHQLPGTDMHGHTYRVTVIHSVNPIVDGYAVPFQRLAVMLRVVLKPLDHRQLEMVLESPATAEELALYVKHKMPVPCSVRVEVGGDGWVETE